VPPGSAVVQCPATSAALHNPAQASSSSFFSLLLCCLPGSPNSNCSPEDVRYYEEDRNGTGPRPPPRPTAIKPPEKIDPSNGHYCSRPSANKSFNASFRSVAPSPRSGNGVTFDQAVEVVAFRQKWPANELSNLGRNYECRLGDAVPLPSSWSFTSNSSFGSSASSFSELSPSPRLHRPPGFRTFPGESLASVLEDIDVPPPVRGCPSLLNSPQGLATHRKLRADSFGILPYPLRSDSFGSVSSSAIYTTGSFRELPASRTGSFSEMPASRTGSFREMPALRTGSFGPFREMQALHAESFWELPAPEATDTLESFGIFGPLPTPRREPPRPLIRPPRPEPLQRPISARWLALLGF